MSELPKFFDSQSQAAAMLKLDSYFLKELKAEGCTAFKPGGRIRRDELLDAIERKRERARERLRDADSDGEVVSAHDWEYRRSVLFDVLEFLQSAHNDKRVDLAQYVALSEKTVGTALSINSKFTQTTCNKYHRQLTKGGGRFSWASVCPSRLLALST